MKEADFDAVLDTNLKGAFFCMKAAVPHHDEASATAASST